MGKCIRCGKKGLFLKVDGYGHCVDCKRELEREERLKVIENHIKEAEQKLEDRTKLLVEAKSQAKEAAHIELEAEYAELKKNYAEMKSELVAAAERRDALAAGNEAAEKNLKSTAKRIEKLKPLVNSIKYAFSRWVNGDTAEAVESSIGNMGIEELLPEPQLNCLSMKQLKSRYNNLRKQIVDLCVAYETRYTTKTNATLYKLMVLALESELENILFKLQFGKLEAGIENVRSLTAKYYAIVADGNQNIAPTLKRFIGQIESLYISVVETEYEYYVQRERAKEEQRALKEQMRQEAEERKRLEQERKHIEAEEKKYQQEIDRITGQMKQAHDAELEQLRKRLAEVTAMVENIEGKKAEIVRLQNGKAGTVYIISNIGSFGDHMFKIGMTRRLEPQDRVNELGDASVPFPFDVHSFIFSEDAVALEAALHKELNDRRVNKVNLRKEFFDVSVDELQKLVERIDPTAPFRVTALAEQYRQSQSITYVPTDAIEGDDEEELEA